MKKLIVWILAICVVFAFAACGGEPEVTDPGAVENPGSPTAAPVDENLETLTTNMWTLSYDPAIWIYDEDDLDDYESSSSLEIGISDGEEDYALSVEISADLDDAEQFRDYLYDYGFDLQEYAENDSYEKTNIGGVDCLCYEGEYWGSPCVTYFGRNVGAGLTVCIRIVGEDGQNNADALLANLKFLPTDTGNQDFPWPWEGEPFSAEPASAFIGTVQLSSQMIPMAENGFLTREVFEHTIGVYNNTVYIYSEDTLRQYAFDGAALTLEKETVLEEGFTDMQVTSDGTIWMSALGQNLTAYRDGAQVAAYEDTKTVTMSPDGTWGINWFSSPECEKFTVSGNTLSRSDVNFAEVDSIRYLLIDDSYIYVCGSSADDSGHKVYIYDHSCNLKYTLADADGEGLGSITYVTKVSNGFLGLDGNMRDVILWAADGTYQGSLEDSDLFSTDYPWFCSGAKLADGSILMILTEDRADQSAMELVAFKLTGA